MAVPSRVVEIVDDVATVECFGIQRQLSLLLLNEPVQVGDYVLAQAGGFASQTVDPDIAREALQLFAQSPDDAVVAL